jgi:hypothetical protein
LEIQQALDDLLLRFIASYRKCPDIPELEPAKSGLLYRGALSMTSIVFAHEDTFRVSQVPEDPLLRSNRIGTVSRKVHE